MRFFTSHTTILARATVLALTTIWGMNTYAATEPRSASSPAGAKEEQRWTINQQNADIREFIAQIAAITGQSFVLDPRIKGGNTVSVISTRPMTRGEIYDIFLEVLNANGFSVVPKGTNNTIVPNTTAKTSGTVVSKMTPAELGTMITRVIDLHSVSAVEVVPIVRPLIAQ